VFLDHQRLAELQAVQVFNRCAPFKSFEPGAGRPVCNEKDLRPAEIKVQKVLRGQ
jgi:hypothetical protein